MLTFEGDRSKLPKELYDYRDALRQKVDQAGKDQQEADLRAPLSGADLGEMRQGLERDLAGLRAQRQALLDAATRPGISARERQTLQQQAASLERVINLRERNMRILEGEESFVPGATPPNRKPRGERPTPPP
jgi:hypothetical protein